MSKRDHFIGKMPFSMHLSSAIQNNQLPYEVTITTVTPVSKRLEKLYGVNKFSKIDEKFPHQPTGKHGVIFIPIPGGYSMREVVDEISKCSDVHPCTPAETVKLCGRYPGMQKKRILCGVVSATGEYVLQLSGNTKRITEEEDVLRPIDKVLSESGWLPVYKIS